MLTALGITVTGWLATQGASLLLGALSKLILDAWTSYQNRKAQTDLAAAQAKVEQQGATIDAQQAELEAQANAPRTVDDAVRRLEEGSA
jgi:hypothetical protein